MVMDGNATLIADTICTWHDSTPEVWSCRLPCQARILSILSFLLWNLRDILHCDAVTEQNRQALDLCCRPSQHVHTHIKHSPIASDDWRSCKNLRNFSDMAICPSRAEIFRALPVSVYQFDKHCAFLQQVKIVDHGPGSPASRF